MSVWKKTLAAISVLSIAASPLAAGPAFAEKAKKTGAEKADPPPPPIEHGKGQMLDKGPRWPHKSIAAPPAAADAALCGKPNTLPCAAATAAAGNTPVDAKAPDQAPAPAAADPCNKPGVQCDPRDAQLPAAKKQAATQPKS